MTTSFTLRDVPAEAVRPLRSEVLRPGVPPEQLVYPGDDHPDALHVGAYEGDTLVGIATVYPEPPPEAHRDSIEAAAYAPGASYRLRGMATRPTLQGQGVGRAVLERCFRHVREEGADVLWCNARLIALPFYQALGLEIVGEEFDIPGIGSHYVMWRRI